MVNMNESDHDSIDEQQYENEDGMCNHDHGHKNQNLLEREDIDLGHSVEDASDADKEPMLTPRVIKMLKRHCKYLSVLLLILVVVFTVVLAFFII